MTEHERIEAEALHWVERMNTGDLSDQDMEAYVEWMEADSAHADAFRRLDAAWIATADAAGDIRARFGPEARADDAPSSLSAAVLAFLRPGLTPRFAATVAAAVAIVIVALQPPAPSSTDIIAYRAGADVRRDVELDDGTRVTLNVNAEMAVSFDSGQRNVRLRAGEAYFDVARDESRPFVIEAGDGRVAVLGTAFNMRLTEHGFTVAVTEGRVAVSPTPDLPDANSQVLTPDQAADVDTRIAALTLFPVDADAISAWRRGQLIYRDAPLAEVIGDISRYVGANIVLDDSELSSELFTGVLTTDVPDAMVERLIELMDLHAVADESGTISISRQK